MRSLIYADWIVARRSFLRFALVSLVILCPIIAASNDGTSGAPGVMATCLFVTMLTMNVALGIFGTDEAGDWQQCRLTMPVTLHQVVSARYTFVALVCGATMVGAAALGWLVELAIPLFGGVLTVPRGGSEIVMASWGMGLVTLGYLALGMPMLYRLGVTKARMAFTAPFLLMALIALEPVRNALHGVLNSLEGFASSFSSPWPMLLVGSVAVALLYVASLYLSERLYASREL